MGQGDRHEAGQTRVVWPPEPGFFRLRLVRAGWGVPAEIIHDDRGWSAVLNGEQGTPHPDPESANDVARIWQFGQKIEAAEYRWLESVRVWALANDPQHPAARPTKAIDPSTLRPILPPK
jgi:hypothetical protein